jgi:hypothetical protein
MTSCLTLDGAPCAHAQARQQLKEMVWIRSSENMVLEAMSRLSGEGSQDPHSPFTERRATAVKPCPWGRRQRSRVCFMHPPARVKNCLTGLGST